MSQHCQIVVYSHAGLPGTFWTTGMSKIDCQSKIYRQTHWISGCNAAIGRKTGCAFAYN